MAGKAGVETYLLELAGHLRPRKLDLQQRAGIVGNPARGICTAQLVVKRHLEPVFHRDSYGYRPGRSAHDTLVKARRRCGASDWASDWVLDLDIKNFFDEIDWELLMKAVRRHVALGEQDHHVIRPQHCIQAWPPIQAWAHAG